MNPSPRESSAAQNRVNAARSSEHTSLVKQGESWINNYLDLPERSPGTDLFRQKSIALVASRKEKNAHVPPNETLGPAKREVLLATWQNRKRWLRGRDPADLSATLIGFRVDQRSTLRLCQKN